MCTAMGGIEGWDGDGVVTSSLVKCICSLDGVNKLVVMDSSTTCGSVEHD